jgi:hypothetical protein
MVRMMSPVHLRAACPNRSYLKAHGFGLDRYIEHPLILEQAWQSRREMRSLEQAQIGGGDRVQADSVKQPERRLV